MDFQYLLKAAGRWNRAGDYGALYTAESARCAAAEFRKRIDQFGIGRPRDLFEIHVRADPVWDLIHRGFPPKRREPNAPASGVVFVVYPENRPAEIELRVVRGPVPLNHGGTPFVDQKGFPTRDRP